MPAPFTVQVTVNQRDIDRALKLVDKYKDAPLAKRLTVAIKGGLKLLVNPIRSQTPRPGNEKQPKDATGNLLGSIGTRTLRKRSGEVVAMSVGPRTRNKGRHRHLVILGHRMVTHSGQEVGSVAGNPFVDRAVEPLMGEVRAFIDRQVRVLD